MICNLIQSPVPNAGPGLWASGGMSALGLIRGSDQTRCIICITEYEVRSSTPSLQSTPYTYSWIVKNNTPYVRRSIPCGLSRSSLRTESSSRPRIRIRRGLTSVFLVGGASEGGGQLGSSSCRSPRAWMVVLVFFSPVEWICQLIDSRACPSRASPFRV